MKNRNRNFTEWKLKVKNQTSKPNVYSVKRVIILPWMIIQEENIEDFWRKFTKVESRKKEVLGSETEVSQQKLKTFDEVQFGNFPKIPRVAKFEEIFWKVPLKEQKEGPFGAFWLVVWVSEKIKWNTLAFDKIAQKLLKVKSLSIDIVT